MATVNKNFRVKGGLIVDGSTGKINNFDILTKSTADQNYIIGLIGGSATPDATPETVVLRDANASFSANVVTADLVGDVTGNADTATALETARTIQLTGDVTGSVSFDGTENVQISTTVGSGFATDSEVATAKQEAIDEAKDYTDTEVAAAIDAIPTSTDELTEGTTNLYYTAARARGALSEGNGINYNNTTGVISADLGAGLEFGEGTIDVDTDIIATRQFVADEIVAHNVNEGVHGVLGEVVGTENVQPLTNKTLSDGTDLGADLDAAGFKITNLGTPTAADDAATKAYVDGVAEGLHVHASVAALINSNIADLSALDGPAQTFDGVTLADRDRVLITGQTNAAENGIYVFEAEWPRFVRAEDYNTAGEIDSGDFVFVNGGSTYGNTGWVQTETVANLGTDSIIFTQFSGAGTYTAFGDGLVQMGNQFYLDFTHIARPTDVANAVEDHSDLDTGVHGIATNEGVVVGTDKNQTLTNKTLGSGTVLGNNLDAGYKQIKNLGTPIDSNDATDKFYVDGKFDLVNQAVEDLTTDDVPESMAPTNRYFTDERAELAVATFLNNAMLTNLTFGGSSGSYVLAAENGVADSTTDDLVEGDDNLYFTDTRAKAAARELLASTLNGARTNITITDNGMGGLDIVAENGVDDSTTDDLDEGETNLYFTDERAQNAINETTPNFAAVDINLIAKQVAASADAASAGVQVAYAFAKDDYRSAEFLVKVAYGDHTEISKVLLTLDVNDNISITEYGIVGTNGSGSSSISADIAGTDIQLLVTTLNNNSTITVVGTLLA